MQMRIHHCRSEKKNEGTSLATLETPPPNMVARPPKRKTKLMLIHQPWCKLKKGETCPSCIAAKNRHLVIQSRLLFPSILDALSIQHSVLAPRVVPMLHCSGPCHKALLAHRALRVSHETPRQSPIAMHSVHVRSQRSL